MQHLDTDEICAMLQWQSGLAVTGDFEHQPLVRDVIKKLVSSRVLITVPACELRYWVDLLRDTGPQIEILNGRSVTEHKIYTHPGVCIVSHETLKKAAYTPMRLNLFVVVNSEKFIMWKGVRCKASRWIARYSLMKLLLTEQVPDPIKWQPQQYILDNGASLGGYMAFREKFLVPLHPNSPAYKFNRDRTEEYIRAISPWICQLQG